MNAISIILATYNRAGDLYRLLQAYEEQTTPDPFEILVVDDASSDQTWQVLQTYQPRRYSLRCERMERNQGQGQARNRAIPLVSSPLVLFTGDDMLPERSFLEAHLTAHRKYQDEKTAILGRILWPNDMPVNSLMTHIDGIGAEQFSFYYLQDGREYDFRHFYTSNISLKRSLLLSLDNWFDPDFVLYGFEDADLGYRLTQKGMHIVYSSAPIAYHYHYHNAYSFAVRQYRSGQMACVLVGKHPELNTLIFGKGLQMRLLFARLRSIFQPLRTGKVEKLEATTLRLLNYYENQSHPLLDSLYVKVLNYFFYKGIVDGSLKGSKNAKKISDALSQSRLEDILKWYLRTSRQIQVPLPVEFNGFLG